MAAGPNGTVMRRTIDEIFHHGALETADILFALAYVNDGGLIPSGARPEAIKVCVALYCAASPNFQVVSDDLVAEGEMVVLR